LIAHSRSFPYRAGAALGRAVATRAEIDAISYANVAFGGAVSIIVLNLLGNVVRGTGNTSLHAGVLVGCVIAHIALSLLLIFGYGPFPALGPAGAGWGLVIPFGVGSLIMILYLRSSRSIIQLISDEWCRNGRYSQIFSRLACRA
jgi:Na+-driven multidrug efflux pump